MEDLQGNVSTEEVVSTPTENYEATQDVANETVDNQSVTSETEEVANPQTENVEDTVDMDRQTQSQEENSRYARIRREAEARAESRARDLVIQEMQMEWGGRPITTYAEYRQALKEQKLIQEAESQGMDPQFYTDFKLMQEELQGFRQERTFMQQEKALLNDQVRGQFYNQWKGEIRDLATTYGVDLNTAFTLILENKLPEILSGQAHQIQNETIKKINQNQNSSVGSLGNQTENHSVNAWDMSQDDFNKMVERAKNGELRKY